MKFRMIALDSEGDTICSGVMMSPMPREIFDINTERALDSLLYASKSSLNKGVLPFVDCIVLIDEEKAIEQAQEL